jgi:hypothetical protein
MLEELSNYLTQTDLKAFLSDTTRMSTWLIIPVSQTVHILSVAAVLMSVAILNVRLLGLAGRRQSFAQWSRQLMPWIWMALAVLLLTGTIQTLAEPTRELLSRTFGIKMLLLLVVVCITAFYARNVRRDPDYWDGPDHRTLGHALALLSLTLWLGIAAAGRLIAYI